MNAQGAINWVEQGYIPDNIVRKGIRRLLKNRLEEINAHDTESASDIKQQFIDSMKTSALALSPEKANEQHYEVPSEFYEQVLGKHNKYSCCYYENKKQSLSEAEEKALQISCLHADLKNGQQVLELGCGWGSLTLWMAKNYPQSHITAVSNSTSQKKYIDDMASTHNLSNLEVITCDMNDFSINKKFDRVVSIEMFEHMRNWQELFKKVSTWLNDDGKFFMHVFAHRQIPYAFEVKDKSDWMSEYFFTGGMMPSDDLPLYFQNDLKVSKTWTWDGNHYANTSNAWLKRMDEKKQTLMPLFKSTYGEEEAQVWWMRWRLFFMACAELFAYNKGQEWHVMHYLFTKEQL